jgi:hypothetical protein
MNLEYRKPIYLMFLLVFNNGLLEKREALLILNSN